MSAVTGGWVMVPREPTEGMCAAGNVWLGASEKWRAIAGATGAKP